jgi:CDP-diacylglycerol--glycerol-3-phosphate 3-phosphatidyltransferase
MVLFPITIATWLTLVRLLAALFLLPLLLVYGLSINVLWLNGLLGLFFVLLGITDFFDGYIARKYHQETLLGAVLDPIADKFLLYSSLVSLLAVGRIQFYWVLILIGREFFIMGLRHVSLEQGFSIRVSSAGKIKTFLYIVALTWVIINPYYCIGIYNAPWWNGMQIVFLLLATAFSLFSAYRYYVVFMAACKSKENNCIVSSDINQ